jgi:ribosomal protein S27AE
MLFTGVALIDGWTVYFAFSFSWTMVLSMGAVAVTCFLVIIISIYFTTVRRTNTGNYEGARSSSLFFSVLLMLISAASIIAVIIIITYAMSGYGFFLAGGILIFPALFFFMGYGKMGEVIARYGPMAVLSDASPVETMSPVPSGAIGPAIPIMPGPAMGMGGMAVPVASMGTAAIPAPPASPQYQHLGGAVPRVPLCPSCGRELYYASNYKRWYCLVCESRR